MACACLICSSHGGLGFLGLGVKVYGFRVPGSRGLRLGSKVEDSADRTRRIVVGWCGLGFRF